MWHEDLGAFGQMAGGGGHALADDLLGGAVVADDLERGEALGRADLGVGVVDVVAGAVGEHRVDQVGLDVGGQQIVDGEPAGVVAGMLVFEVPADLAVVDGEVGVDQQRRGRDRVAVGAAHHDSVLGLDPADLWDCHVSTLTNDRLGLHANEPSSPSVNTWAPTRPSSNNR